MEVSGQFHSLAVLFQKKELYILVDRRACPSGLRDEKGKHLSRKEWNPALWVPRLTDYLA